MDTTNEIVTISDTSGLGGHPRGLAPLFFTLGWFGFQSFVRQKV